MLTASNRKDLLNYSSLSVCLSVCDAICRSDFSSAIPLLFVTRVDPIGITKTLLQWLHLETESHIFHLLLYTTFSLIIQA